MFFGAAVRMKRLPKYGAIVVPRDLKACVRFKRLDAVVSGPIAVT